MGVGVGVVFIRVKGEEVGVGVGVVFIRVKEEEVGFVGQEVKGVE